MQLGQVNKVNNNKMLGEIYTNIIGTSVAEPEMKQAGQRNLLVLRLAVNEKIGDGERTSYITVNSWRDKLNDKLMQLSLKGKNLKIRGPLHIEEWEKDGHKFQKPVVTMDNLTFLDKKDA
jgi:single-stranded DNA-binding protein